MSYLLPIKERITLLSPLLFLWSIIYYKGLSYIKSPSYINGTIHTTMILLWLSYSYDNLKYVIPWSQSYFIFDTILSSYILTKPIIINSYNMICTHKKRYSIPTDHIGYLIHHIMALYLLYVIRISPHLSHSFIESYMCLEYSNLFLYSTYFIFQKYGKLHPISITTLGIEICGYGYIRGYVLLQLILKNWSIFPTTIRYCAICLYCLGLYWIKVISQQFISSIKKKNKYIIL